MVRKYKIILKQILVSKTLSRQLTNWKCTIDTQMQLPIENRYDNITNTLFAKRFKQGGYRVPFSLNLSTFIKISTPDKCRSFCDVTTLF